MMGRIKRDNRGANKNMSRRIAIELGRKAAIALRNPGFAPIEDCVPKQLHGAYLKAFDDAWPLSQEELNLLLLTGRERL
jgi:hypothetical protein